MLNFACDVADKISQNDQRDLLELYCGNGNFTLPLSKYFNRVLATELAKSSVNSAKWAIDHNDIRTLPSRVCLPKSSVRRIMANVNLDDWPRAISISNLTILILYLLIRRAQELMMRR